MGDTFNGWGHPVASPGYGDYGARYDLTATCADQALWASQQAKLARAGAGVDSARSAGAAWDGKGSTHPSAMVTAPRNTAGASLRAAYWLGLVARIGINDGIGRAAIDKLIGKSGSAYAIGTVRCGGMMASESVAQIQDILRQAADYIEEAGITPSKVTLPLYYLGRQQDASAIAFTQETKSQADLTTVLLDTAKETALDIPKVVEPVVNIVRVPFDAMAFIYKYGPWILLGVGALSLTAVAARAARNRRAETQHGMTS